jgi:hypothetical protein
MREAIEKYRTGKYGINKICQMYEIPKPTFLRHLKGRNVRANEDRKVLGRATTFDKNIEKELEDYVLHLEEFFFGVTITDVRKAAYDVAEKNRIRHNFNARKRMAGKKWYYNFIRRHPNISLRKPESTSLARNKGFNRENVFGFFDILEKIVDDNNLTATKIFNVDESGFSTVQKKNQKILARKGKSQVGVIASGERGVNTTMVVCTSAAGQYVAPMIIFKRKRMVTELGLGAPPGCIVQISDTGYSNSELFLIWLKEFIKVVKPSKEDKVLLLLDGHTSHSKNLAAIELTRANGVIILQLPGHTTHRLQPLDVSIFGPLETYYNQAVEKWMREHPGLAVTQFQVAELLSEAYGKAATLSNAMGGFRKSGIWPVNRNVFTDVDFAPSDHLQISENLNENDRPSTSNRSEDNEVNTIQESDNSFSDNDDNRLNNYSRAKSPSPRPSTPVDAVFSPIASTSKLDVSVQEILHLPPVTQKTRNKTRAQTATVITSTPYKDDLESKKLKVDKKSKQTVKRKCNLGQEKPCTSKTTKNISIELNEEEWFCALCTEHRIEDMSKCTKCSKWMHESCANITSANIGYTCDFCT